MLPFSGYGPINRSERKALLVAAAVSVLFIFVLSLARPHKRTVRTLTTDIGVPFPVIPSPPPPSELSSVDLLEPFRVQPEQFEQIDFRNHSYGPHTWADGKKINLRLSHSELRLPNDSGWFSLKDVYYRDVTGDGIEEAIVWLTHLQCNAGTCNRTDLFYIYTIHNGTLKPVWEYETGSYAEGCGLRGVTFWEKQINLMLFGECPKQATIDPGPANFTAGGFTHILLEFDGRRFIQRSTEYYITPPKNLRNYEPAININ